MGEAMTDEVRNGRTYYRGYWIGPAGAMGGPQEPVEWCSDNYDGPDDNGVSHGCGLASSYAEACELVDEDIEEAEEEYANSPEGLQVAADALHDILEDR